MRVLIAEDDAAIRDLLHDLIERQGHAVTVARDGEEAWAIFGEHGADVIISDWLMPRVEGPELCRRVRESDAPYTYFILLTALGDQQHQLTGRKSGADDYLAKPFDMEELAARMVTAERVIMLHRRREALLRLARQVATATEPATLFETLLDEALRLTSADVGTVSQVGDEGSAVVARRPADASHDDEHGGIAVPLMHEG